MKDYLVELVRSSNFPLQSRNLVREYLQARILSVLQNCQAMIPLAFQGGTALRFLYRLPRFSEDLDFALERPERGYDFRGYLRKIKTEFEREAYRIEIRINDRKVVNDAFLRFQGLLFELGLSSHADEVLAVKIEVDTNPPQGAGLDTSVVRRHVVLHLHHHDRASLFAGKVHAILQRSFTKGRDLFDLLWYLSDPNWPLPNLLLLNKALSQGGWDGQYIDAENWRGVVLRKLEEIDWQLARQDVQPFLERPDQVETLSLETFKRLLER